MNSKNVAIHTWEDDLVFREVLQYLRSKSISGEIIGSERLLKDISDEFSVLIDKKSDSWKELEAIKRAETDGIPTFVGSEIHEVLNDNYASKQMLKPDFNIPEMSLDEPFEEAQIIKPRYETDSLEPSFSEEDVDEDGFEASVFYEKCLGDGRPEVEYKMYGVWKDDSYAVGAIRRTSPLLDSDSEREQVSINQDMEDLVVNVRNRLNNEIDRSEIRLIGIDALKHEGEWYVIDINSGPSYRGTKIKEFLNEAVYEWVDELN